MLASLLLLLLAMAQASPPNIVFVMIDDLGWNGLGFHNPGVRTPAIDALAADGMRLGDYYTYKVCAPARASMLTGRFPYKLEATKSNFAYFWTLEGTHLNYTMFPEKLRDAGYRTHMVGKWHQGFYMPEYLPTSRGFDSYLGFLSGCEDHNNQANCCSGCPQFGSVIDLFKDDKPAFGLNGTYTGYTFGQRAVEIIREHGALALEHGAAAAKPLFLYIALHNTHAPFQVPAAWEQQYNYTQQLRNIWSGMVGFVDGVVSNVTTALHEEGLWENTLLIVTCDNGSPIGGWGAAGSNAPLRGGKASNWEGGVHVPAVLAGGWLPASRRGSELRGLAHVSDWYATFAALAGADASDPAGPAPLDSLDLSEWLFGNDETSPRQVIVHDHSQPSDSASGAIRVGDMKLIVGKAKQATWFGEFSPNETYNASDFATAACNSRPCLFNISADPTEHVDVAEVQPDVAAGLLEQFHALKSEYHPPGPAGSDRDGYCCAAAKNGGFMVPWVPHNECPPPAPAPPAPYAPNGTIVPSTDTDKDLDLFDGATLSNGHKDDLCSGRNIRTGNPGQRTRAAVKHWLVGVGHKISRVQLAFRYSAGYTPPDGEAKTGTVVSVVLLRNTSDPEGDYAWGGVLPKDDVAATLFKSGPLEGYSWDHFASYSPPIVVDAGGLAVDNSEPLQLAFEFSNNQRNLQIPIDDIRSGWNITVTWADGSAAIVSDGIWQLI